MTPARNGLRQYCEHQEDLRLVRGRIASKRQFTVFANRQDIVACEFDDLTADNPWNQFIKAGLRSVRQWIAGVELRRRWTDLMIAFDDVSDLDLPAAAYDSLYVDRRTRRCLPSAEWARRILALQSPALRVGQKQAPGLLFDVNRLWEEAVAIELGRRLERTDLRVHAQARGTYLATIAGTGRPAMALRPDIVISRKGRTLAVADTRWKRVDVGPDGIVWPAAADAYQMEAYAAAFGCEELMLVYPWHRGLLGAGETVFNLPARGTARPRLSVLVIDVSQGSFLPRLGAASLTRIEDAT